MKIDGLTCLALNILRSAVSDYKTLKKKGVEFQRDRKYGNFSIDELTEFFEGEWCKTLLSALGTNLTGEDILEILSA